MIRVDTAVKAQAQSLNNIANAMDETAQRALKAERQLTSEVSLGKIPGCLSTEIGAIRRNASRVRASAAALEQVMNAYEAAEKQLLQSDAPQQTPVEGGAASSSSSPVEDFIAGAPDAEYAILCHFWNNAAKAKDPSAAFREELETLPEGDPLRSISPNQVHCVKSISGFSAVIINDGKGNAIVLFAGTNGDPGDFLADAQLTFGASSLQAKEANALIEGLSKKDKNIVVAGHSLGGYLATSVTLHSKQVSRCIAFDPPGRWDSGLQGLLNRGRVSRVTTYEARGSEVSAVGFGVGNVRRIRVKEPNKTNVIGSLGVHNHGIRQIADTLGGREAINRTWSRGDL